MRHLTRALLLAGALLAPAAASAQQRYTHHACLAIANVADKILFVGRQIVEIRNTSVSEGGWAAWPDQEFEARVRGLYSRADMEASDRFYANGYFSRQSVYRSDDVGEAKSECLRVIRNFRTDGYDVYGVGSPLYSGRPDEEVREIGFLSSSEFPNYQPGTIAARVQRSGASSGGSSGGGRSSSSGDSGQSYCDRWPGAYVCMSPAQQERFNRMRQGEATNLMNEGDAYWDARRYPEALQFYRRALFMGRWLTDDQADRANERIRSYQENGSVMEYARWTDEMGVAFGGAWTQSHLTSDGGLLGATLRFRAGGLGPWITWAGSVKRLSYYLGDTKSLGGEGEMTRYAITVGAPIPKLHGEKGGIHAGYTYQKTDARELNLLTAGLYMGSATGFAMRLDVTPVYGKPKFGVGMIVDFGGN